MAGLPGIVIQIGADTKDAVDGINRVRSSLGDSMSGFDKFKSGVDKAFVPALAALGGLGVAAVDFAKAAAEDAQSAAVFANALQNTTKASDAQVASTEEWISAQGRALGVADDQLRPAIQKLAAASGSLSQAQKDAAIAMDLAAQAGVPVETAANAITRAYGGSYGALKKLVPGLDEAALKNKDFAAVMGEVQTKVGGAAQVVADSAQGGFARFNLAIGETKESIGAALLPAVEALLPKILEFANWAQDNTDVLLKVGAAIGVVAGGIVVLKGVLTAVTVAQQALNLAMSANPIGLVVLAIAALVAALVYLYNNNEDVRKAIDAAWAGIKQAIDTVVQWFQNTAWPIIRTVLGYLQNAFNVYLTYIKTVWAGVQTAIDLVVRWFRDVLWPAFQAIFALLRGDWDAFGQHIRNLWDGLIGFFGGIVDRFAGLGRNIIDAIRRGIENAWGAFTSWLSGIFRGMIDNILGIFGISSPSKVFMGIGEDIVAGYQRGLAGMAQVNAGVIDSAGNLVTGMPTVTTANSSAFGSAGGNVHVSEELVVRALSQLLTRSDLRNGRAVAVV
jgi:hypothetical protein